VLLVGILRKQLNKVLAIVEAAGSERRRRHADDDGDRRD
jgi:hypothetical protein